VRKTSVYLPDELKDDLAALAGRWDRSEAELLRLAVERLVRAAAQDAAPATTPPRRLVGPCLVGVGVGPGDPELVTERAVLVLHAADRVFTASTAPDAIGRAEAAVRAVAPEVRVDRIALDDGSDPLTRQASLRHAADALVEALDHGASVAFAVLGDPNVYSTFSPLADAVTSARPSVPISTVPGIMAFQALAARSRTVLASDAEHIAVLVADGNTAALDAVLADPDCTVVLYKGGRYLPAVAERLDAHGRLTGAVVGELLGLAGARCVEVASVADRAASYLATVVVPASRPEPQ
jgi:precorrin-2/cobalt-factor-2 C20-methyltransferase